mmetsp:Transcript_81967/g.171537  ORF Transcript_81967/g.171537 Transcript_81967/m.171537 type:complete len:212 (-) Transcript_81967:198-833(-)
MKVFRWRKPCRRERTLRHKRPSKLQMHGHRRRNPATRSNHGFTRIPCQRIGRLLPLLLLQLQQHLLQQQVPTQPMLLQIHSGSPTKLPVLEKAQSPLFPRKNTSRRSNRSRRSTGPPRPESPKAKAEMIAKASATILDKKTYFQQPSLWRRKLETTQTPKSQTGMLLSRICWLWVGSSPKRDSSELPQLGRRHQNSGCVIKNLDLPTLARS